MTIKSFLAVAITSSIFGISCSNNDQEAVDKSLKQEAATTNSAATVDSMTTGNDSSALTSTVQNLTIPANSVQPVIQPGGQPASQVITQQVKPQATTAATKTAPGMNPPHGQPGHRCDIEVGAPLNSPAKKAEPVTIQPSTATSVAPNTPTTISTTPTPATNAKPSGTSTGKVNPPHGQPGHKCEIAVGAPLN